MFAGGENYSYATVTGRYERESRSDLLNHNHKMNANIMFTSKTAYWHAEQNNRLFDKRCRANKRLQQTTHCDYYVTFTWRQQA